MLKLARNNKETLFVIVLSTFISLFSSAKFISQLILTPFSRVFIGIPHYYADYFYYLDQFYQGAHGGWATVNNFTSENFPAVFIYFNNILLGKIGGIFGLESYVIYYLSLLILKLVYLLVCYKFIRIFFPNNFRYRIISFLLFVFSTSFPMVGSGNNSNILVQPMIIFRAKNTFFTRFSNIPGLYFDNIIFLLLLIVTNKYFSLVRSFYIAKNMTKSVILKIYVFIGLLIIMTAILTLSDPVKSLIFVIMFLTGFIFLALDYKNRHFLLNFFLPSTLTLLVFVLSVIYMKRSISSVPVYSNGVIWDYEEYVRQFSVISISSIMQSFGFLGIFTLLGFLYMIFKQKNLNEKIIVIALIISFAGFIIPAFINISYVPGFRFILKSTFLFMALISTSFFVYIKRFFGKTVVYCLIAVYFLINSVTICNSLIEEIKPLKMPDYNYAYLDKEMYDGFVYLRNLYPKDAVVLANPGMTYDLFIPGLTGKKTFTGHFLLNYNSQKKNELANKFYYQWTDPGIAYDFLSANKIKYIIVTKYTFTEHKNILTKSYPFLKPVYSNKMISIFSY